MVQKFLKGKRPGKDYFLKVNNKFDISKVIRPRDHKLLKKINIFNKNEFLWRTFSSDQLDLNYKNPAVLIRFIKIMINLINNGVNIFRLDAIAYLWKESGTKCINLKKTHEIIKLIRIISNSLKIQTLIVTETNLPEQENLSYFGKNDEANLIYNFSLPPLLIQAFLFENSFILINGVKNYRKQKMEIVILTLLPLMMELELDQRRVYLMTNLKNFLARLKKNGSKFSYRKIDKNKKKVYEANITVFDALKITDYDKIGKFSLERYISAHAIMISLDGVPAIYFNSLFGTSNDEAKFVITGNNRDINRYKWNMENI